MTPNHPLRQIARRLPGVRPAFRWLRGVRESRRHRGRSAADVFTDIYRRNAWDGAESVSGTGSSQSATSLVAEALPAMARSLDVRSVLDIPCGDYHWMRNVEWAGIRYIGADIVTELIERNQRYADSTHTFRVVNLLDDPLPEADLILCRDCLVHFSHDDVFRALSAIAASPARYLLTTTFPECASNRDIVTGHWRRLNLEGEPFRLPPPVEHIAETSPILEPENADKTLALWHVDDLRARLRVDETPAESR